MTNHEVQLVQSESTGKFRILFRIQKDENLDVAFIMDANQAEQLGLALIELSRTARGKNIIIPMS